jgi:hypothetical protein
MSRLLYHLSYATISGFRLYQGQKALSIHIFPDFYPKTAFPFPENA